MDIATRISSAAIQLALGRQNTCKAANELLAHFQTEQLAAYLEYNCLAPLAFESLVNAECPLASPDLLQSLRQSNIRETIQQQAHSNAIKACSQTLTNSGIKHAFIKGAAARVSLYTNPLLRPAADVDVLVAPTDRTIAVEALTKNGFQHPGFDENASHETILMHGQTEIDLHWHLMRPARLPEHVTTDLLEEVTEVNGLPVLSPEATATVQLIHPTYTKYVNSPWAKDIRVIDFQRLSKTDLDWTAVAERIEAYRARTAAWCNLLWFESVSELDVPTSFAQRITPPAIKRAYLKAWIIHGLTRRFYRKRNLMRLGFTWAAHDRISDAIRATSSYIGNDKAASQK